ncbi:hypothetical protein CRV01_04995 [Arcobacter sp. CECT 8983]|uniref:HdrB C-terminal domain-containing protein n=1 Tax=Arcobacter sp. CECT 8983 TaxID=2044508 RepID=UPI00100B94D9|nr:DUF5644 domain-containing protein [Arcobacter sp. CECT 8983]RXJ90519.1 hypothetical protein CRV01_04995 [Arcobacter sp. CECT 8983]
MILELSIFRFDAKSDYLPYYKKHFIKIKKQETLLDIFNEINIDEPFDFIDNKDFGVVVNKKYTTLEVSIKKLVDNFGKDLIIEPLSIRRANKDFIIDQCDFEEKLEILNEFTTTEDKSEYLENKLYFYASNTLNFQYEYIGDAIILLAHKLIERTPSFKDKILKLLQKQEYSVEYHTSLENRLLDFDKTIEEKINQIKNELGLIKSIEEQNFCIDKSSNVKFHDYDLSSLIKHDFNGFNLTYYYGKNKDSEVENFLNRLNAKQIKLENENIDLNLETFHLNQNFIIKLAATIMLEAFDAGADLLIVDSVEVFKLFDANRLSLSKAVGREVIIPVLHKSELFNLSFNEHEKIKKELFKHEIDPEII